MKKIEINKQTITHWRWIMIDRLRQLPYFLLVHHLTILKSVILVIAVILAAYLVGSLLLFTSPPPSASDEPITLSVTSIDNLNEWIQNRSQIAAQSWTIEARDYFITVAPVTAP